MDSDLDIDEAANRVIGITNTLGAAAANVQNSRQTIRTAHHVLVGASRRPNAIGAAGAALLAVSAALKFRNRQAATTEPTGPVPATPRDDTPPT